MCDATLVMMAGSALLANKEKRKQGNMVKDANTRAEAAAAQAEVEAAEEEERARDEAKLSARKMKFSGSDQIQRPSARNSLRIFDEDTSEASSSLRGSAPTTLGI